MFGMLVFFTNLSLMKFQVRYIYFFSVEMIIYTLNVKKQSPGTVTFMGARDTKNNVRTKRKN